MATESPEEEKKRGEEGYQIPEAEKALVKRFIRQIEKRMESKEHKRFLKDIDMNREYARGIQNTDENGMDEHGVVRANLILPELKKVANECYAKNPEIAITPTENVGKDRYEVWKGVGKTLEIILNNQFSLKNMNMKAKGKRAVNSANTTGFGWLKVIYQKDIAARPDRAPPDGRRAG